MLHASYSAHCVVSLTLQLGLSSILAAFLCTNHDDGDDNENDDKNEIRTLCLGTEVAYCSPRWLARCSLLLLQALKGVHRVKARYALLRPCSGQMHPSRSIAASRLVNSLLERLRWVVSTTDTLCILVVLTCCLPVDAFHYSRASSCNLATITCSYIDATSESSSSEEDHLVGSTSAAAKQNSVPPSSRVTRQSSRSGSELAGDEGQASRKEKNRSTAQRNERQVDEEDNDNDDDDDDETPPPPPQSAKRASTRIASQPQQPRASTSRTKSFAGKSLPGASKTKQVLKTLKTEAAKRRKKTGFVSSRRSGAASGEDGENVQDSPDEGLATVVENDDDDDSDRDGDLNNIPRTRSLSIAGVSHLIPLLVINHHPRT